MSCNFDIAVRAAHEVLDPHFVGRELIVHPEDALLPILLLMEHGTLASGMRVVEFDNQDLQSLLAKAETSGDAYDAAVELCIIRSNLGPFEPALLKFHSRVLRQELSRPKKRGPNPDAYRSRNYIITRAVHKAALKGELKIYRNSSVSGPQESACDAVAQALGENGYRTREYSAIAKIASSWDIDERLAKRKIQAGTIPPLE